MWTRMVSASLYFALTFILSITSQKVQAQQVFDTLITTHRMVVLFDSDSDVVTPIFHDSINSLSNQFRNIDNYKIVLNAHTDDVGSIEYNEILAAKRLKAIENVLSENEIIFDNIRANAHGKRKPLFEKLNARNRKLSRRVEIDFMILQKVKRIFTKVVDKNTNDGLRASVVLVANNIRDEYISDDKGQVDILYPMGSSIVLESQAKDYFFRTLTLKPNVLSRLDTIVIKMSSPRLGSKFSIEELNFVGDKCELLNESLPSLYQLRDFMILNEDKCVQIGGHINLPGEPNVNVEHIYYDLSVSRSNVIYDSLRMYGVNKNRIYTRGYGNWEMKFPKSPSISEQKQNRRVELTIEDCTLVATMENHVVKKPSRHGYVFLNKRYDPLSINLDLKEYHDSFKKRIFEVIEILIRKGEDPEAFSYGQLIKIKN